MASKTTMATVLVRGLKAMGRMFRRDVPLVIPTQGVSIFRATLRSNAWGIAPGKWGPVAALLLTMSLSAANPLPPLAPGVREVVRIAYQTAHGSMEGFNPDAVSIGAQSDRFDVRTDVATIPQRARAKELARDGRYAREILKAHYLGSW